MDTNTISCTRTADLEFTGAFDRVTWSGNGTTILKLTDGRSVVARGTSPDFFHKGFSYLFLGTLGEYKGKPQINASSCKRLEVVTEEATITYLQRVCQLNRNQAQKLYRCYGQETLACLRDGGTKAIHNRIMLESTARDIQKRLTTTANRENLLIELNDLFARRGFLQSLPEQCIATFGARAGEWIRRNPFLLLTRRLPSAGVKRCDKLWLDLGKPEDALKRQFFWLWQAIDDDMNGDTWFDAKTIAGKVLKQFGEKSRIGKVIQLGLRARWLRSRDAAGPNAGAGGKWITSKDRANAEWRIAEAIVRLSGAPSRWPELPTAPGSGPSDHQRDGLAKATRTAVGNLVGSPGTGKTYTVAFLIKAILAAGPGAAVQLVAPTGKAAVRLTQSMQAQGLDIAATTIHRALGVAFGADAAESGSRFAFNAKNPLPLANGFLIVDETSMVDAGLMADLLDAVPTTCCVLFVGDTNQLAPVGHGAPLRDFIEAGVPTGKLTEIQRNAGRIVWACAEIRDGKPFAFSAIGDPANGENLVHYPASSPEAALALLETILTSAKRYHPVRDVQVIVARNQTTPLSKGIVNVRLAKLLNGSAKHVPGNPIGVGDKVICIGNSTPPVMQEDVYSKGPEWDSASWIKERGDDDKVRAEYVANGEIGYVLAIGANDLIVQFDDGRTVQGRFPGGGGGGEDGKTARFELAYAVTGHKMQGSEAKLVIILVDKDAAMVASREWHYTSMSRAKELCVVIGDEAVMRAQVKRKTTGLRKTFLAESIGRAMASVEGAGGK